MKLAQNSSPSAAEMKDLEVRIEKKEDVTGVPSDFRALDRVTYGWQPTDLIIIAARPSVGKSAFALNLALNAAFHPEKPTKTAVFTLEMSNGQVTQRCMAAKCEVKLDSIKRGRIDPWELAELRNRWSDAFVNDKIYFDDTPGLTILELRAKARRLVHKHGVRLIIIDYLQLMSGGGDGKNGNREQEISKISRQLKALAKELNVPIIALSQLSRDVEKRGSKEPMLSDLRESGAIEQDADVVGFLYRDDYQKEAHQVDESERGRTFLKIAKNRNGSLETITLKAELHIQKFREPDFMENAPAKYIPLEEANARYAEQSDLPF
jgi:replicative DNA helicase